jgi:quercetin dioxygenase-like cupin family protein
MAERISPAELDRALEALMSDRDASLPSVGPKLAALLALAAELRGLPSDGFKARLRAQLVPEAASALPAAPPLVAHDLRAALAGLPELSMRFLGSLDRLTLGVSRFGSGTHWERHPDGDELLHVLEGEAEITTLTEDGPLRAEVGAGSLFVCPQGLWHRIVPRSPVSLFFATPGAGIEHSKNEPHPVGRLGPDAPPLVSRPIDAALRGAAPLAISEQTSAAEADAAFRTLATCNQQTLGVMRFSGQTPWERHSDGDELLHALDGAVDVTVLTDEGPRHAIIAAGSVFVCPRGLWHRQQAQPSVTMLFATPTRMTEVSFAEDPRTPT